MEAFKNVYNREFFEGFTDVVIHFIPSFNKESFLNKIFDADWDSRELKERMRHITIVFKEHLSDDYSYNLN